MSDDWGHLGPWSGPFDQRGQRDDPILVAQRAPTATYPSDEGVHFGDRSLPEVILDPIGEPLD